MGRARGSDGKLRSKVWVLGRDERQAVLRNAQLEELFNGFEGDEWPEDLLPIAEAIRKGASTVPTDPATPNPARVFEVVYERKAKCISNRIMRLGRPT